MKAMSDKELSRKLSVVMTDRIRPELMTCEDVVAAGRYPYTGRLGILSDNDRKIVQESMELVHAQELKDCDFTQISDGQRQRILLAKAICQEPEIIILDEPTSFLDIRHKLELLTILKSLCVRSRSRSSCRCTSWTLRRKYPIPSSACMGIRLINTGRRRKFLRTAISISCMG